MREWFTRQICEFSFYMRFHSYLDKHTTHTQIHTYKRAFNHIYICMCIVWSSASSMQGLILINGRKFVTKLPLRPCVRRALTGANIMNVECVKLCDGTNIIWRAELILTLSTYRSLYTYTKHIIQKRNVVGKQCKLGLTNSLYKNIFYLL